MITLITGGSGSGKSAYAEQKVVEFGDFNRIYIATMYPFDEESHQRIAPSSCYAGRKKFFYCGMLCRLKKCENTETLLRTFRVSFQSYRQ